MRENHHNTLLVTREEEAEETTCLGCRNPVKVPDVKPAFTTVEGRVYPCLWYKDSMYSRKKETLFQKIVTNEEGESTISVTESLINV